MGVAASMLTSIFHYKHTEWVIAIGSWHADSVVSSNSYKSEINKIERVRLQFH